MSRIIQIGDAHREELVGDILAALRASDEIDEANWVGVTDCGRFEIEVITELPKPAIYSILHAEFDES